MVQKKEQGACLQYLHILEFLSATGTLPNKRFADVNEQMQLLS